MVIAISKRKHCFLTLISTIDYNSNPQCFYYYYFCIFFPLVIDIFLKKFSPSMMCLLGFRIDNLF
jgi:hypothetical protein